MTNIKGVAYTPLPSDDQASPPPKYFDTDFTNSHFPLLYSTANNGRGDHATLQKMGVNFVHLYDWSVPPPKDQAPGSHQRDHLPYFASCARRNIRVFIPISNFFLGQRTANDPNVPSQIAAMVAEAYNGGPTPVPGAGIWGVGNEYDLATGFGVAQVVQAMALIVKTEMALGITAGNLLPVTSPVSFSDPGGANLPAIRAVQTLLDAMRAHPDLGQAFIDDRFIASINSFNDGPFLASYIDSTFPTAFNGLPFFISELGVPIQPGTQVTDEQQQADYVLAQLKATRPRPNFLGACVFQFLNQSRLKQGTEATFGIFDYSNPKPPPTGTIPAGYDPGGGQTYIVDVLRAKPMANSVTQVFHPTIRLK